MIKESNAYLYIHRRLDTNDVFYVGIGIEKKFKRAFTTHCRNKWWKNIVKKTGFVVDIIYKNISWEQACKYEINLISMYGRKDLNKGNLVNMTSGGEGALNAIRSEETRKKMSIIMTGKKKTPEHIEKVRQFHLGSKRTEEFKKLRSQKTTGELHWNYGKHRSEETKLKLSIAHKGKILTQEHKNKISELQKGQVGRHRRKVIDVNTKIIYETVTEAAKFFGIKIPTLIAQLSGKSKNKTNLKYYD
jgi:hypothetical protein